MSFYKFKYLRSDEPNENGVFQMKEGELYFELHHDAINYFNPNEFPFTLQSIDIFGNICWSSEVPLGNFVTYWDTYEKLIIVKTATGKQVINWTWNDMVDGDICYKLFRSWTLSNIGSRGIAVGVNDGSNGEWVKSVMNGDLFAVLVEPTAQTCHQLRTNWSKYNNVKIEEICVTDDGKPVNFYEGEHSVCNSIIKSHSQSYSQNITERLIKSTTISDLKKKWDIYGDWWLHIDCEGYDDKIIYSLDDGDLPSIICFEHVNFNEKQKDNLLTWLDQRGYITQLVYMNGISIKK